MKLCKIYDNVYVQMDKAEDKIEQKVVDFFRKNPKPKDEQFHKFVETLGKEHSKGEEAVYKIVGNLVSGGLSQGKIEKKVDPKELKMGIKVELEHTNDKIIAEKIARDHLAEFSNYYTELKKMESGLEKAKNKIKKVMQEFKTGTLHSGSKKGPVVKDRKQAIAIALNEAGESKYMKKNVPIGTVATWGDGKQYKKVSQSNWEPVDHSEKKKSDYPSGGKKNISTHSELHEQFMNFIAHLPKEKRRLFLGGKMDFQNRKFISSNGENSLKWSDGNIRMEKAKYIRRTGTPGNYKYFYKEEKKKDKSPVMSGEGKEELVKKIDKFVNIIKDNNYDVDKSFKEAGSVTGIPLGVSEKFQEVFKNENNNTPKEAWKNLVEYIKNQSDKREASSVMSQEKNKFSEKQKEYIRGRKEKDKYNTMTSEDKNKYDRAIKQSFFGNREDASISLKIMNDLSDKYNKKNSRSLKSIPRLLEPIENLIKKNNYNASKSYDEFSNLKIPKSIKDGLKMNYNPELSEKENWAQFVENVKYINNQSDKREITSQKKESKLDRSIVIKGLPKIGSEVIIGKKDKRSVWVGDFKGGKKAIVVGHDKLDGEPVVVLSLKDKFNDPDYDRHMDYEIVYPHEINEKSIKEVENESNMQKAKAVPVGTVSGKYKKVGENKWVPISEGKEPQPKEEKEDKKEKKQQKDGKFSEETRSKIKDALKKIATIFADALSAKEVNEPTAQAIEGTGESLSRSGKRQIKKEEKTKNVRNNN